MSLSCGSFSHALLITAQKYLFFLLSKEKACSPSRKSFREEIFEIDRIPLLRDIYIFISLSLILSFPLIIIFFTHSPSFSASCWLHVIEIYWKTIYLQMQFASKKFQTICLSFDSRLWSTCTFHVTSHLVVSSFGKLNAVLWRTSGRVTNTSISNRLFVRVNCTETERT